MTKSECGLLCAQLKNLQSIYEERTNEIGVDISETEQKELLRGREQKRRGSSLEIGSISFHLNFWLIFDSENAQRRNSYENPKTGETIQWVERKLDDKVFFV